MLISVCPPSSSGSDIDTSSITVSNSQPSTFTPLETKLDYLVVIGCVSSLDHITDLIHKYFDCRFDFEKDKPFNSGHQWDGSIYTPTKIQLLYNRPKHSPYFKVRVSISGLSLARVSPGRVFSFCRQVFALEFHSTRMDLAIDDTSRSFLDFSNFKAALESNNYTGFALDGEGWDYHSNRPYLGVRGQAYTLGSRKSNKYYRIYDKTVESRGAIDSIRFEAEFTKSYAKQLFDVFCQSDSVDQGLHILAQTAVGSINFIDRTNCPDEPNITRIPQLDWWRYFCLEVGGCIKLSVSRRKILLADKLDWLRTKVAGTMAVVIECIGVSAFTDFMCQITDFKLSNLNSAQKAFIRTAKPDLLVHDYDFSPATI